ncbi:MAG: hypothetical protein HYZ14_03840 [Bacteroidetes bacterium]|nr:hypothetical protein [Bacteroidota bacterium]
MFGLLVKKKLDHNRLANVFVNSLNEAVESGFQDIADMINDDPAFVHHPGVNADFADGFLLIVMVGNLRYLDTHFEPEDAREIRSKIIEKVAAVYEMNTADFEKIVNEQDSFISRVNHPSKNTLYGMSKALFHKFNLNDYQEVYFKSMRAPNPLFLKRMDEIMLNYLWDWDAFFKKHRLQSA